MDSVTGLPYTELEVFEQERIEEVISSWERKVRNDAEDFKRYSKGLVDMDELLFNYVENLTSMVKAQEAFECRQDALTTRVKELELKQRKILSSVETIEAKVLEKLPQKRASNHLESISAEVSRQIGELEDEILDLQILTENLQTQTNPDKLSQILLLVNNHCRTLAKLNAATESLSN